MSFITVITQPDRRVFNHPGVSAQKEMCLGGVNCDTGFFLKDSLIKHIFNPESVPAPGLISFSQGGQVLEIFKTAL